MRVPAPLLLLVVLVATACHNPQGGQELRAEFIGKGEGGNVSLQRNGDTLRLMGHGKFLTDTKDDFTFASRPMTGKWQWQVRLDKVPEGGLAGVMVRDSRSRSARYFLAGSPGNGRLVIQTRLDSAGPTYHPLPEVLAAGALHFFLDKDEGQPGNLQVRDSKGFLQILSFPEFNQDTLWVGLFLLCEKGGEAIFREMTFDQLPEPPFPLRGKTAPEPTPPMPVGIVSHRGACHGAPENSLPSRDAAIHCGADILEADVRLTADGVAILLHDETLERTTNGRGDVASKTWQELRQLHLRNPDGSVSQERIPDLVTAMESSEAPTPWLLDKAWDIRDQVVPLLRAKGLLDRAIFKGTGSAKDAMDFLAQFDERERPQYLHLVREDMREATLDSLLGMDILGLDVQITSEESWLAQESFVQRVKAAGKGILLSPFAPTFSAGQHEAWHPEASWRWAIECGATWIQTDLPCELSIWKDGSRTESHLGH